MNPGDVHAALAATINPNAQIRKDAELALTNYSKVNGFTPLLLETVISNNLGVPIQQSAAIYLKNQIISRYNSESNTLPQEDKNYLRASILNAVVKSSQLHRSVLCGCLNKIISTDYPVKWPTLVDEIITLMSGQNDPNTIYASLLVLSELLKSYKYAMGEENKIPVFDIVRRTFPILSQMFSYLTTSNTNEFAILRKLIVKCFWYGIQLDVPEYFIREPKNIDTWMDMFQKVFQMPSEQSSDNSNPHWGSKKWILHIVYRLFLNNNLISMVKGENKKKFAKYFMEKYSLPFLALFLNNILEYNRGNLLMPSRVVSLCFYYIGASIRNKEIYNIALKSKLETLIKDVIFPQLYYSQHDQEMWEDDLQEYLRVNFDFVTDVYSVKTSAGNALFDLLETRKEDAMQLFLQLFDQGMKQNNAKISDGMLYALGNMKKPIMTDKTLRSQLEGVMVNYVIPNFASNQAHLRARACWTAGIYALIKWENRDSLLNVVRNILNSLQDNHLIVKVQAGTSLTGFLQNASIIPEVRPLLPKLLNLYIQMMQELDYGDVVQSIDDLIEAFSSEIEPYALELLQNMVARCHTLFDQDDEDDQNDLNDDNIEEFGEGEIVCSCCLKVILTVLNSVGNKNQHLLRSAQELIVPLLEKILMDPKDRGFDYYEEVCGISASLTYFHDGELNGATIWRLFPALFHSFQQYANYYISNLISPLDNFISKGNKVFLSDRRYMDAILHILEFFLNDEEAAEKETQAAALLASVLLQSCRGQIDQDFAKIMTLVFKKLSHCETNSLKILLTNCLCDAFLYSVPMTFDFMTRTNSTAQVFGLWLQIIPKMSRVYDMKCSLLGLDSLLSYPELSHLPQVVQTNIFFIVQNCVKLLVKIEAEKKKIAEYEAEAEEESKIAEQRIMNGEHFDMQDEGFEDDFEDEDDQDEPYEQEGDQDVTGIVKTKQIQSLLKEISECEWDKQGHDDDELEEEADFNSILDTIDENLTFGTTMLKFSQKYNPQFVQITSRLSQEEQNSLRQLMSLANK